MVCGRGNGNVDFGRKSRLWLAFASVVGGGGSCDGVMAVDGGGERSGCLGSHEKRDGRGRARERAESVWVGVYIPQEMPKTSYGNKKSPAKPKVSLVSDRINDDTKQGPSVCLLHTPNFKVQKVWN